MYFVNEQHEELKQKRRRLQLLKDDIQSGMAEYQSQSKEYDGFILHSIEYFIDAMKECCDDIDAVCDELASDMKHIESRLENFE